MDVNELAKLVNGMRVAQRRYFLHRRIEDLHESKYLEHKVDMAVAEILDPGLFNQIDRL